MAGRAQMLLAGAWTVELPVVGDAAPAARRLQCRHMIHNRAALAGKTAVVTGASRGIGEAIARALAEVGCNVALAARSEKSLRKVAAACEKAGVRTLGQACDVSDEKSVATFFAAVKSAFRRIDILINNAGVSHAMATVDKLSLAAWNEVLAVNLTGTFLCTRAALPLMRSGGVIVNNLSVAARGVFAGESAYCAAKHGALGFTDTLREEVRERGIRVIALLPGPTDTELWNQFWPEAPREKMMRPETVAAAVVGAIALPENATVEELRIAPTAGRL